MRWRRTFGTGKKLILSGNIMESLNPMDVNSFLTELLSALSKLDFAKDVDPAIPDGMITY